MDIIKLSDLTAYQNELRGKADDIIGMAMQLRSKLKNVISEPLPEDESDALIIALSAFIKEAKQC